MDVIHLSHFLTIARSETLTQAAGILHISQPALSASLSKLEQELGVQLFDRVGRRLVLNRYGNIFLHYADRAVTALETAENEIEEASREESLRLNISTVSMHFLQNYILGFITAHPEITLRRSEIMPKDVEMELNRPGCDFVLSSYLGNHPLGTSERMVDRDSLVLAVRRDHPLADRKDVTLSLCANDYFIALPKGYAFREHTDELCRRAGFECHVVMEAFHCHLLQNVLSGAGIAIVTAASVPNGSLLEVQDDSALRFLPIRDSEAYQSIVLRWNDRHPLSPASEMFLKYVEDAFSERQKCVTCPDPADPDRRCRTTGECAACTVAFPR